MLYLGTTNNEKIKIFRLNFSWNMSEMRYFRYKISKNRKLWLSLIFNVDDLATPVHLGE